MVHSVKVWQKVGPKCRLKGKWVSKQKRALINTIPKTIVTNMEGDRKNNEPTRHTGEDKTKYKEG